MTSLRASSVALVLLGLAGCAVDGTGPDDGNVVLAGGGKADGNGIHHGRIAFGEAEGVTLSSRFNFHSFDFVLESAATVRIETNGAEAIAQELDTVLELYAKQQDGSYRKIAENDNAEDDTLHLLSRIERMELGAGDYRVIVKGDGDDQVGSFSLIVDCDGAGCGAVRHCAFGDDTSAINEGDFGLAVTGNRDLESPQGASALDEEQIVIAMHESVHHDVTSLAEAFEAADDGGFSFTEFRTSVGDRFTMVTYGAGDNEYGAIFRAGTADKLAAVQDGEIRKCSLERTAELPHPNCQAAAELIVEALESRHLSRRITGVSLSYQESDYQNIQVNVAEAPEQMLAADYYLVNAELAGDTCRVFGLQLASEAINLEQETASDNIDASATSDVCKDEAAWMIDQIETLNGWSASLDRDAVALLDGYSDHEYFRAPVRRSSGPADPSAYLVNAETLGGDPCLVYGIAMSGWGHNLGGD